MTARATTRTTISVDVDSAGKGISPDLFGAFFEDLNYAADGGLYAERVQNRSFAYHAEGAADWHSLMDWEPVELGGGRGGLRTDTTNDDILHLAVIDARDHGLDAASMATVDIGADQNAGRADIGLAEIYAFMDQAIAGQFGPEHFVTAQMMRLDIAAGHL